MEVLRVHGTRPEWGASGWLMFRSTDPTGLWVVNTEISITPRLMDGGAVGIGRFSPDGDHLAFTIPTSHAVHAAHVDGGRTTPVSIGRRKTSVVWSPRGDAMWLGGDDRHHVAVRNGEGWTIHDVSRLFRLVGAARGLHGQANHLAIPYADHERVIA
jgi:hypothetical protein